MWLLKGTIPELLDGEIFANYVFMDEKTHRTHSNETNILYVDLKKLSEMDTKAGELARVLLGVETEPKYEEIKEILY